MELDPRTLSAFFLSGVDYLIAIPAYNAAPTLVELVKRVRASIPTAHILVVDDGSTDHTGDLAEGMGVQVIRHSQNRGKGEALRTAFTAALEQGVAALIQLDADLQHAPESIGDFVRAFEGRGADIVVGHRDIHAGRMPIQRQWSNRITSRVVSVLSGRRIPDSQCGYRLISRRAFEHIQPRSSRFEFESEFLILAGRAGMRIESVPIETLYQGEGTSIRGWRDTIRFVKMAIRLMFTTT